jgi:hypothetical protein
MFNDLTIVLFIGLLYSSIPIKSKKTALAGSLTSTLKYYVYFFSCVAQYADFPIAGFLHFVPCLVFPAHIAFFLVAISTSLYSILQ